MDILPKFPFTPFKKAEKYSFNEDKGFLELSENIMI